MSFIHCTNDCVYQSEGCCKLEKAAEISGEPNNTDCLHFKPNDKMKSATPVKSDSATFE